MSKTMGKRLGMLHYHALKPPLKRDHAAALK